MSKISSSKTIEKLTKAHNLNVFDCGVEPLNKFLHDYALSSQKAHSVNSYVAIQEQEVIGFYSLTVGSVLHINAPKRVTQGLAKHPVPVMILARLAVDHRYQDQGIGRGMLKDALLRTAAAADIAGMRALLVHAKDEEARDWYAQFDFEPSPTDPLHLYLLMKDIKKNLKMP